MAKLPLAGLLITLLAAIGLTAVLVSSATNGDPANSGHTGGGPPVYQPRRITEGTWWPPIMEPGAEERANEAEAADREKPRFQGTLNGFDFITLGTEPDPHIDVCPGQKITTSYGDAVADSAEFPFQVAYLPPDMFEYAEAELSVCQDGRVARAERQFVNGRSIQVYPDTPTPPLSAVFVFLTDASDPYVPAIAPEQRVRSVTIAGKAGVVIEPVTPEGGGLSIVAFTRKGGGQVTIQGTHFPLDEMIKIAENLKCAGC